MAKYWWRVDHVLVAVNKLESWCHSLRVDFGQFSWVSVNIGYLAALSWQNTCPQVEVQMEKFRVQWRWSLIQPIYRQLLEMYLNCALSFTGRCCSTPADVGDSQATVCKWTTSTRPEAEAESVWNYFIHLCWFFCLVFCVYLQVVLFTISSLCVLWEDNCWWFNTRLCLWDEVTAFLSTYY